MASEHSSSNDKIFDLNYVDTVSPLSKAAIAGNLREILKLLLSGKSPQAGDNRGWTAIHYCAASNQYDALKLMLKLRYKQRNYLVNLKTFENHTPLFLAVKHGASFKISETLLKAGADPKVSCHTNMSPLHLACLKSGNIKLVKILLEYGADPNAVDVLTNSTPLHFAVTEAKDVQVIELLIRVTDLTIENSSNRTAFLETIFSDFYEAFELFLKFNSNLSNSWTSFSPLACAGFVGNLKMVNLLLKKGANVNSKCKAFVFDPARESFGILLDVENYLPVHSCLTNIHIFELLLRLTSPQKILEMQTNYCSFPIFVLVHSKDVGFYEILLQSHLPEELTSINSHNLVHFIKNCSWERELIEEKFQACLRYNFNLEPNAVFAELISIFYGINVTLYEYDLLCTMNKFLRILSKLVEMGVTGKCCYKYGGLDIESKAQQILRWFATLTNSTDDEDRAIEMADSLRSTIPSLKQISRQEVRKWVRSIANTNWQSFKTIENLNLPRSVINFLLFRD